MPCLLQYRYRYSEEEIPRLLNNLSSWVDELNTWQQKVADLYRSVSEKEGKFLNSNFNLSVTSATNLKLFPT